LKFGLEIGTDNLFNDHGLMFYDMLVDAFWWNN